MGKFTIIVFVVYALYYAVIVAYDLFLKKDTLFDKDIIEEHTFEHVKEVSIENVETANVPESYIANDLWTSVDSDEDKTDINILKENYEIEESIEKHLGIVLKTKEKSFVEENNTEEAEKEEIEQEPQHGYFANDAQSHDTPLNSVPDKGVIHKQIKPIRSKNKYKSRPNKYTPDEFKQLMSDQKSAIMIVKDVDGRQVYSITKESI